MYSAFTTRRSSRGSLCVCRLERHYFRLLCALCFPTVCFRHFLQAHTHSRAVLILSNHPVRSLQIRSVSSCPNLREEPRAQSSGIGDDLRSFAVEWPFRTAKPDYHVQSKGDSERLRSVCMCLIRPIAQPDDFRRFSRSRCYRFNWFIDLDPR